MPGQMIGDNVLPEAVQERRRSLRSRLQSVREPIRSRREQAVPGPDVIGKAETTVQSLKDKVVQREGVLSRIRERRSDTSGQAQMENETGGNMNQSGSTTMQ